MRIQGVIPEIPCLLFIFCMSELFLDNSTLFSKTSDRDAPFCHKRTLARCWNNKFRIGMYCSCISNFQNSSFKRLFPRRLGKHSLASIMSLSTIDPSILPSLADLPAGVPPKGVEANFHNPFTLAPLIYSIGTIFVFIVLFFVGVRFYAKMFLIGGYTWDDRESDWYLVCWAIFHREFILTQLQVTCLIAAVCHLLSII